MYCIRFSIGSLHDALTPDTHTHYNAKFSAWRLFCFFYYPYGSLNSFLAVSGGMDVVVLRQCLLSAQRLTSEYMRWLIECFYSRVS